MTRGPSPSNTAVAKTAAARRAAPAAACAAPAPRVVRIAPQAERADADGLDALLAAARACRLCADALPLGPRPLLQASASARILIVGQAPGARAHASGEPWADRSGERLRDWMGIDASVFYDAARVAIVPMGLCFPGRAASGDRAPPGVCAPLWLDRIRPLLPRVALTLVIGAHAQRHLLRGADRCGPTRSGETPCEPCEPCEPRAPRRHARGRAAPTLTQQVRDGHALPAGLLALPHPSPRNVGWFIANPWFEAETLPVLRAAVAHALRA